MGKSGANLIPKSPKPSGGPVAPRLRTPGIKYPRAAKNPKFIKVIGQLRASALKAGTHPPAKRKADEAQAAAKGPPDEKTAGGRANQVDDMKDAKAEKPNKGGFLAVLRAEIEKVMPKTNEAATKFMQGGEKEQIKSGAGANVKDQKQKAAGPTEQATKAPPDTAGVEGKDVTPMPPDAPVSAPPVPGAQGMPDPKPQAEVKKTADDASASADKQLKDNDLTDPQLKKANDPRFSGVLTSRDKAKETAQAGAQKFKTNENKILNQAQAQSTQASAQGTAGLAGAARATGGKTKKQQLTAKEKDELELRTFTADITSIFDRTKTKVESKLATLEQDAMALFDRGTDAALAAMKRGCEAEIDRFKDDRYSGIIGKGKWLVDKFRDTLPQIKAIIAKWRQTFTTDMDKVAVGVAAIVDQRLAAAKALVDAGQAEVKARAAKLSPHLRAKGAEAVTALNEKFDELRQSVDDKAQDLAEKLAQKYKDASEKADSLAKEIDDANKGALKALADKIAEIVKMLAEFADRVVSLFKKAAGVLKKIVADPIGFLGNLLSAIKQGIAQFVNNIWSHIKKGFMTWLFGELTKAGVEIPSDLSLPSILKLVLGVLGLTWANIRPKIVKKIGERAVSILEKVVELLQKLFTGGFDALWAEMKAFVGDLKSMVIDAILDWVITKVITSAITKVASMFNPAGAIIQAIIMVYNVGSWLVANIGKILDFIESVVNSVDRIANGDVGGAASFIEQALGRMIPILIGFLAGLLGLGGLSDKVKSFITKVQAKVGKAVDFVIDKVFNAVKKIIGAIKGAVGGKKDKKDGKPDERTEEQKRADLGKALQEASAAVTAPKTKKAALTKKLASIKSKYRMTSLEVVLDSAGPEEAREHVTGEINPKGATPTLTVKLAIAQIAVTEQEAAAMRKASAEAAAPPAVPTGPITDPARLLPAPQGKPKKTITQVANARGTGLERGQALEEHLQQSFGGDREVVEQTQLGVRRHDNRLPQTTQTDVRLEAKNYLRFIRVKLDDGTSVTEQRSVPLSKHIQAQIDKDTLWVRAGRKKKPPEDRTVQWVFANAPPSSELAAMLQARKFPYVTYG